MSKPFTVSIASLLSIVTASIPNRIVAVAYSATLAASDGTPRYNWSLASGRLPPGLSLSVSGAISGTPTAAGSYSFTIQVNESGEQKTSRPLRTLIASPISVTTTSLPNGTVNEAYSATLSASGGTSPYTWTESAGSPPAGATLSSSATISETPTAASSYSFTIWVRNSGGQNASEPLAVMVYAGTWLDRYGGVTQRPCPNGLTGEWYTQQIGKRWVLCDPLGNAFNYRGVDYIVGDSSTDATYVPVSYNMTTASKYGNSQTWFNAQLSRLQSWGFNGEGVQSYREATDRNTYPKMPFVEYPLNPALNNWQHCTLYDQCKNLWNLRWPPLVAYNPNIRYNITDAWEPHWPTYAATSFNGDSNLTIYGASPYNIGFSMGDSDFCSFCSAGVDFPGPFSWPHAAYIILGSAPHAWLNKWNSNALFTDQTNNTKAQWSIFLSTKYSGSITALNTAWGTGGYYTTFGTAGTQVTGAACAAGNGGSSYSCTSHTNIDRFSLRIDVGGTRTCADDGFGNLAGPGKSSCGTVNYSRGAITLALTVASGVAITVDYWHDGYGVGTGILDEWADKSVHLWIGDQVCLNNGQAANGTCNSGSVTTAAYRADMNNFLRQYVTQFFTVLHTALVNALPSAHKNKLFFGISDLGQVPGRLPARCQVMAGAAAVSDVIEVSTDTSKAQLDFITGCIGNKPYTVWESVTANCDSDWYGYCPNLNASNVATQAARASQYNSDIQNLWNHCNSTTGNCQWVGESWWSFLSLSFWEHTNFGLVSWRDNAYDGHEDMTGSVACSAPLATHTCGGEQKTYGNFLGPATVTNKWVDTQLLLLK